MVGEVFSSKFPDSMKLGNTLSDRKGHQTCVVCM